MDQLDILKRDWEKQEGSFPKLSKDELSKLLQKKSSSIVKWIFIISVLEFVIPNLAFLFIDNDTISERLDNLHLKNFEIIATIVFYLVALVFIYIFYKNYKSISASSNSKTLMQNIMRTRRTVKYYIWFVISFIPVIGIVMFYKAFNSEEFLDKLPEETSLIMVWGIAIILLVILMGIFWLFYQLLYGILLRKLKHNYKELVANGDRQS